MVSQVKKILHRVLSRLIHFWALINYMDVPPWSGVSRNSGLLSPYWRRTRSVGRSPTPSAAGARLRPTRRVPRILRLVEDRIVQAKGRLSKGLKVVQRLAKGSRKCLLYAAQVVCHISQDSIPISVHHRWQPGGYCCCSEPSRHQIRS